MLCFEQVQYLFTYLLTFLLSYLPLYCNAIFVYTVLLSYFLHVMRLMQYLFTYLLTFLLTCCCCC